MKKIIPLVLLFLLPIFVFAQETKTATTETKGTPAPITSVAEPTAPYDKKMLRLSEVLGSIHYLRALCGAKEGSKWRDVMSNLLVAEKPGPKRKALLIGRFNRGFSAYNRTYGSCTGSALLAAKGYMEEGAKLSAYIAGRYGR